MELNNVHELKDIIGEVLVTITPEMFRRVKLSELRRLDLRVQPGGHYYENCVREGPCKSRALSARASPYLKRKQFCISRCLKRKFAILHRFSQTWPPDWTQSCKRHHTLSMAWLHISGMLGTKTSPKLSFSQGLG